MKIKKEPSKLRSGMYTRYGLSYHEKIRQHVSKLTEETKAKLWNETKKQKRQRNFVYTCTYSYNLFFLFCLFPK